MSYISLDRLSRFWTKTKGYLTSNYAAKSHTHNYAGASSAGGSATSANKLASARTITVSGEHTGSVSFDGSANVTLNVYPQYGKSGGGNKNNWPYHRFAKLDTITGNYQDRSITLLLTQDNIGGCWGIVQLLLRTNSGTSVSTVEVRWLVRYGFAADAVQVGLYNVCGSTYADAFLKSTATYQGTVFRVLASGTRGNVGNTWTLINSSEVSDTTTSDKKTSTEVYASVAAAGTELHNQAYSTTVSGSDVATVKTASSASTATKATQDSAGQQINTTYIKGLSVSGKVITYTKGNGTTGTITTQDTNTTYSPATASANGLMTAAHYSKVAAMPVITVSEAEPTSPATGDLWAW